MMDGRSFMPPSSSPGSGVPSESQASNGSQGGDGGSFYRYPSHPAYPNIHPFSGNGGGGGTPTPRSASAGDQASFLAKNVQLAMQQKVGNNYSMRNLSCGQITATSPNPSSTSSSTYALLGGGSHYRGTPMANGGSAAAMFAYGNQSFSYNQLHQSHQEAVGSAAQGSGSGVQGDRATAGDYMHTAGFHVPSEANTLQDIHAN